MFRNDIYIYIYTTIYVHGRRCVTALRQGKVNKKLYLVARLTFFESTLASIGSLAKLVVGTWPSFPVTLERKIRCLVLSKRAAENLGENARVNRAHA